MGSLGRVKRTLEHRFGEYIFIIGILYLRILVEE